MNTNNSQQRPTPSRVNLNLFPVNHSHNHPKLKQKMELNLNSSCSLPKATPSAYSGFTHSSTRFVQVPPPVPATSINALPTARQHQVFLPPGVSSNFGIGINQNVIMQPKTPTNMLPGSISYQGPNTSYMNVINGQNIPGTGSNNHIIVVDKPFLNPKAKEFSPLKKFDTFSPSVTEFKPTFSLSGNSLTQSQNIFMTQQANSSQQIRPCLSQSEIVQAPVFGSTETASSLYVNSGSLCQRVVSHSLSSSVNAETQTMLSGIDGDVQLCAKCKSILSGQSSQSCDSKNPKSDVVPVFQKIKDISMQHKLKYLACKAAVFVREAPTVISQPQELKSKLLNRLNKMCSYFGAELSGSTSWQDDIACSVAINLLKEEPDLSLTQNSARFLRQLKDELESHMEIAKDILNQQKEVKDSTSSHSLQDNNRMIDTTGTCVSESNNRNNSPHSNPSKMVVDNVSSFAMSGQAFNHPINTSSLNSDCVLTSSLQMGVASNNNAPSPNVQMDALSNSDINVPNSNLQMDSVLNSGYSSSNIPLEALSNTDTLSSFNLQSGSTTNNNSALRGIPLIMPNSDISNLQIGSLTNCADLNMNLMADSYSSGNQFIENNNSTQDLLGMQRNCLQMLARLNSLNQPPVADSMNSVGTELSSDKFVSEIIQHVAEFKLDSCPPSELSPSLNIEDSDNVSLSLSKCSGDRVRHLSSSTSNSDSDKNVKKKQHFKDLTGSVATKRIAPLDFRNSKPKNVSQSSSSVNVDEMESKCSPELDSRLSALYISVTSDKSNEVSAAQKVAVRADENPCKGLSKAHSEHRPIRRLTPLQRKLLKKNENLVQNETALPKTIELDEKHHLTKPGDVPFVQNEVALKSHHSKGESGCNSFTTGGGDTLVMVTGDRPNYTNFLSSHLDNACSKRMPVSMEGKKSERQDLFDLSHANSVDKMTLRASSNELLCDTDPSCNDVADQIQKIKFQDHLPSLVCDDDGEEKNKCNQMPCMSNTQSSYGNISNREVTPLTDITSKVNQKVDLSQNGFGPEDNFNTYIPSVSTSNPTIGTSQPSSSPFTSENINCFSLSGDDATQQFNTHFQSYSEIVKQNPIQQTSEAINKGDDNEDMNNFLNNNPSFSSESLLCKDSSDSTIFKIETTGGVNLSNEMAVSCPKWSSLFVPSPSSQHSHPNEKAIDEEVAKTKGGISTSDVINDSNNGDTSVEGDFICQSPDKFGKYGLDDFSTTPPSLKHNDKTKDVSKLEEETRVFESKWKVVKKKSKKTDDNVDMDILLQNFRTDNYYADLCRTITGKYQGITKQNAQYVLETVFVETDGMCGLDEWEVLEEVEVALTEMCPDKLAVTKQQKPSEVEKSESVEKSETKGDNSCETCPFQ